MTAPNPNSPRAKMRVAAAAFKAKVSDYLEVNGPATNEEIAAALGCEVPYLRSKLAVMTAEGIVHSELIASPGRSPFIALYSYGPGENNNKREMTQRTVHKWKPQPFRHDPLHAAFFGPAKQQG